MDPASVEKPVWLGLLRTMLRARRAEERLIRLYRQGKIVGGVYLGIGQEAIGASTTAAAGPDDLFAPCIRDMTVHLGRGDSVLDIFRIYFGRVTSNMKGRDGNIHHGTLEHGVFPMISHLGAMLPLAVGGVMAKRRQKKQSIGFAYIGEGGTSTGDFHEAVNFAAVYDVPVLFVIENNRYAYSTPDYHQYRCKNLSDRAVGYGIEGHCVDGNDAMSLFPLVKKLAGDIRRNPRPMLLECKTMRMRGHGEHDDAYYVPKELKEEWERRDPVANAIKALIEAKVLTQAEFDAMDKACMEEVSRAVDQAAAEPPPDPATFAQGVYAET